MSSQNNRGSLIMGAILIAVGALMLFDGPSLFDIIHWLLQYWPVALILLGVYLIVNQPRREYDRSEKRAHDTDSWQKAKGEMAGEAIYRDAVLGDIRVTLPAEGFKSGEVKTMAGSVVIDASQINPAPGEHRLYLRAGVGDIHVDLRPGIAAKIVAHVALGDIKIFDQKADGISQELVYRTPQYTEAEARLLIECQVGLGDIKVF